MAETSAGSADVEVDMEGASEDVALKAGARGSKEDDTGGTVVGNVGVEPGGVRLEPDASGKLLLLELTQGPPSIVRS